MARKSVRVKGHTRSPRGPNGGKARPHVTAYKRATPKASSYPRAMNRKGHKATNPAGHN